VGSRAPQEVYCTATGALDFQIPGLALGEQPVAIAATNFIFSHFG
jgi:hypothetical protein